MGSIKRSAPTHNPPLKKEGGVAARAPAQARTPLADDATEGQTLPDNVKPRMVERPDGFYWQDEVSAKMYGPFPTMMDAMQDMQYREDSDFEEGESLQEAEAEIGIADWVDPETGELAEGLTPHRGGD